MLVPDFLVSPTLGAVRVADMLNHRYGMDKPIRLPIIIIDHDPLPVQPVKLLVQ